MLSRRHVLVSSAVECNFFSCGIWVVLVSQTGSMDPPSVRSSGTWNLGFEGNHVCGREMNREMWSVIRSHSHQHDSLDAGYVMNESSCWKVKRTIKQSSKTLAIQLWLQSNMNALSAMRQRANKNSVQTQITKATFRIHIETGWNKGSRKRYTVFTNSESFYCLVDRYECRKRLSNRENSSPEVNCDF